MIFGVLYKNSKGHWNNTVETLSTNVLKDFADNNAELYKEIASQYEKNIYVVISQVSYLQCLYYYNILMSMNNYYTYFREMI